VKTDDPSPAGDSGTPHAVSVARTGVRVPLALTRVEAIARRVLRAERARRAYLGITFVTRPALARLHREVLGAASETDIVTLEHRPAAGAPRVGEVFIAPATAAGNAKRFERPVREELARLVIHGTLHALGWEHPEGVGRESSPMWKRQEALLRACRRERLF
jgi:probable rRNA maturation factor